MLKNKQPYQIEIHVAAPDKPLFGQRCNGCGVCCLFEPCPVASMFLWQYRGRCQALHWHDISQQYRCGLVSHPDKHLFYVPLRWRAVFGRFFKRRIAADTSCDFDATIE